MKKPQAAGQGQGDAGSIRHTPSSVCPHAEECRRHWLNPDPDSGATCAHCYQVLPRFVLARIIEGRTA